MAAAVPYLPNHVCMERSIMFAPFALHSARTPRGSRSLKKWRKRWRCCSSAVQQFSLGKEEVRCFGVSEEIERRHMEVLTLGNLCVDVIVNVENLPPEDKSLKQEYMRELIKSPPDESCWEGGGNSNFLFAASRIGLSAFAYAYIGQDIFGKFLRTILEVENINVISVRDEKPVGLKISGSPGTGPIIKKSFHEDDASGEVNGANGFHFSDCEDDEEFDMSTLVCWVLIDKFKQHSFFSRFDVTSKPSLERIQFISSEIEGHLRNAKSLFCNGFLFDEFPSNVAVKIFKFAKHHQTKIFFDPGPRIQSLVNNPERNVVFEKLLNLTDVLLLTHEEGQVLSKEDNPLTSLVKIHKKFPTIKWVIIKLGKDGCILSTSDGIYSFPGFEVSVNDTVGCGDSFAAAIVLGYIRGLTKGGTLALANAVGAATAMGQGAGRNVATAMQTAQILSSFQDNEFEFTAIEQHSNDEQIELDGVWYPIHRIQPLDPKAAMKEAFEVLSSLVNSSQIE